MSRPHILLFVALLFVSVGCAKTPSGPCPRCTESTETESPELAPMPHAAPQSAAVDVCCTDHSDVEPEPETVFIRAFPGRTGAIKAKLIREGGTLNSEQAVAASLKWLTRQQKDDGGWEFDAGDKTDRAAATGLALLPFLAAGQHHSVGVNAGLDWLIKDQIAEGADAGKFKSATSADSHAIATLALCEAYGMRGNKELLAPAQRAIDYLSKMQTADGSWPAAAGDKGDTSLIGWPMQALKAATLIRTIKVDPMAVRKTINFLDFTAAGNRKAMYGQKDNSGAAPGTSLTAAGLLCRYYFDNWGPESASMAEGVLGLLKRAPKKSDTVPDMYFHYYATQVLNYYEYDEWDTWNKGPVGPDGNRSGGMRDWLIGVQIKKEGPNEGSTNPDDGWVGKHWGRLGTTALSTLTLEVYYRHLPLFKRGNRGALKDLEDVK